MRSGGKDRGRAAQDRAGQGSTMQGRAQSGAGRSVGYGRAGSGGQDREVFGRNRAGFGRVAAAGVRPPRNHFAVPCYECRCAGVGAGQRQGQDRAAQCIEGLGTRQSTGE